MQKQRIGQLLPYLGSQTSNAGTLTWRPELIPQTNANAFVSARLAWPLAPPARIHTVIQSERNLVTPEGTHTDIYTYMTYICNGVDMFLQRTMFFTQAFACDCVCRAESPTEHRGAPANEGLRVFFVHAGGKVQWPLNCYERKARKGSWLVYIGAIGHSG